MKNNIPVLEKALSVLKYIGAHPGSVSRPELSEALGISQATCYRIVATLEANSFLVHSGRGYDLSTGILPLAEKVMMPLEKYASFRPALENLARKLGFSVKFSVRDKDEHLNVVCAKAPWDVAITTMEGARAPMDEPSSVAAVLLSESEGKKKLPAAFQKKFVQLEEDHFCFNPASRDHNERWKVDALSVPVRRKDGTILGALTLLSIPGELAGADQKNLASEMHKCAEFCTEIFG